MSSWLELFIQLMFSQNDTENNSITELRMVSNLYLLCVFSCSVVSDSEIPWTVAHQAPLSMRFSRQEYWSGLPCPPPGDLPNPGIKPRSLTLQADSLLSSRQVSLVWFFWLVEKPQFGFFYKLFKCFCVVIVILPLNFPLTTMSWCLKCCRRVSILFHIIQK